MKKFVRHFEQSKDFDSVLLPNGSIIEFSQKKYIKMIKHYLEELIEENESKVMKMAERMNKENSLFRINPESATAGFYLRHIAEGMILLNKSFFGTSTALPYEKPLTMRVPKDEGAALDLEETKQLLEEGFKALYEAVEEFPEEKWGEIKETPFFGQLSLIKSLAKTLNHNAHHCGQIELCIKKGQA